MVPFSLGLGFLGGVFKFDELGVHVVPDYELLVVIDISVAMRPIFTLQLG